MQVLNADMKLALGFIISLFLSLQHVSAQSAVTKIPGTEVNSTMALDDDQSASSGSGVELSSGDIFGKLVDENASTTSPPFFTINSNEIDENPQYNDSVTPIPDLSNSTTNETDPDAANSTEVTPETPFSNYTTAVTFTGNLTTTRSPGFDNSTKDTTNTTLPATPTSPTNENYTNQAFPTAFNESFTNETTTQTKEGSDLISTINKTAGSFGVRGENDRGFSSDSNNQHKTHAWGAFLGVTIAVAIVATVIYVVQRRRSYRDFSHRKLVEDAPQEPVLRLDNSEPLDLKRGGFAYYNPGLQGDNIQMTNFPRGQYN